MIFDASQLANPTVLQADLCVVGSGAGGSAVAMVAAEAGLRVIVLEPGAFLTPSDMTQREDEMLPELYWHAGARTTADRAVKIHQGRGVGGSTLHNLNLCKRIPETILEQWETTWGLSRLSRATWDALYDEVEELLSVSEVPRDRWNRHNQLLETGCSVLGWRGGGLSHNRTNCVASGFCEIGCAYDAKNNAFKVLIPRAVRAGAEIITRCQAVEIAHDRGRVSGVAALALDPVTGRPTHTVTVRTGRVCLSASATGTPAILRRSEVPDPSGRTGRGLRIHPAVVVAGDFEEPVEAWRGIPQTYECTEWLDFSREARHRLWIVPAFAHPMGTATMLPGHGAPHRALMERYGHLAVLTAMLHDHSAGTVEPDGDLDVEIDYWPNASDRAQLSFGLSALARLLFAAGAQRVFVPTLPVISLEAGADPSALADIALTRGSMDLTAVHPMASVPMADDPGGGPVDSAGKHHHMDGLWVGDGSLFPTSIGVPPQLSIYALGLHVGRAIVGHG